MIDVQRVCGMILVLAERVWRTTAGRMASVPRLSPFEIAIDQQLSICVCDRAKGGRPIVWTERVIFIDDDVVAIPLLVELMSSHRRI